MDPYENLANAIVRQAADDYRVALKAKKANPGDGHAAYEAAQIERFFRSAWYRILTGIDAEWLIGELKKEVFAQ